jgi:hypothetical protein
MLIDDFNKTIDKLLNYPSHLKYVQVTINMTLVLVLRFQKAAALVLKL